MPLAAKELIKALKKQDDKEVIKYINYIADLADFLKGVLNNSRFNN